MHFDPTTKRFFCEPRRPILVVSASIAYVPLTQGMFALIDVEDVDIVSPYNWFAHWNCYRWYAHTNMSGKVVKMHRLLMGAEKGIEIDHVRPEETLDNRRSCNLRAASKAQNMHNRGRNKNNTSGYKGVHFAAHAKLWHSRIEHFGKRKSLGYFSTPEAAHAAYIKAAKELHGEFARW